MGSHLFGADGSDTLEVSASTAAVNFGGGGGDAAASRQQQPNSAEAIQHRIYLNASSQSPPASTQTPLISSVIGDAGQRRAGAAANTSSRLFNDPSWPLMWYLVSMLFLLGCFALVGSRERR